MVGMAVESVATSSTVPWIESVKMPRAHNLNHSNEILMMVMNEHKSIGTGTMGRIDLFK